MNLLHKWAWIQQTARTYFYNAFHVALTMIMSLWLYQFVILANAGIQYKQCAAEQLRIE